MVVVRGCGLFVGFPAGPRLWMTKVTSLDRTCKPQKDTNLVHAIDHNDTVESNKKGYTIQRIAIVALLRHHGDTRGKFGRRVGTAFVHIGIHVVVVWAFRLKV